MRISTSNNSQVRTWCTPKLFTGSYHTMLCITVLIFLVGFVRHPSLAFWQDNVRPIMYVQLGPEEAQRFHGNTTVVDHFKLIQAEGDFLLVAARNAVYNLSLSTLTEVQKLEWYAENAHVELCLLKGRSEQECQNYIRVLALKPGGKLVLCGTNAYKPMCREYQYKDGVYAMDKQFNGQGLSPYDPNHNSTAVLVDGELFVGSVADFSGMDPLIYREPLRTEQYDATSLNGPNYVSSFTFGDFVYFLFRETAIEYMNCGKTVYSRIARICKHDRGGPHKFRFRWTSFLKARLNCSVPGDFPFYFDEIQSMSGPFESRHQGEKEDIVYATFSTPLNAIAGSAVCAFRMQDIAKAFEGAFKEQAALNANWLSVPPHKVPEPRPGQCVNDSVTLPDMTLNFIKTHSLMDEAVSSLYNQPLLVRTGFHHRFTKIIVDPQVKTPDGKAHDVMFIGTDNGKVIKAVRTETQAVIVEEIDVFPQSVSVTNLYIHRSKNGAESNDHSEAKLVVISNGQIAAIKLQRCYEKKYICSECVKSRDPYCAWDKRKHKCQVLGPWSTGANYFQNINTGIHESCSESVGHGAKGHHKSGSINSHGGFVSSSSIAEPSLLNPDAAQSSSSRTGKELHQEHSEDDVLNPDDVSEGGEDVSDDPKVAPDESPALYTVETLAIAVAAGSLAALFLGFVLGYCCGRKCRKDEDDNMPYPDTEYEYFEQRQNHHMRSRLNHDPKLLTQEEATYAEPILVPTLNKSCNLNQAQATLPLVTHPSPKATLRKLANNANVNNTLFDPSTANVTGNGSLFPFTENYAPPSRSGDHYSSFRSRDAYGGSVRSHQSNFGPGACGNGTENFGTLRTQKNLGDGFGTTRSVKKVYL